MGGAYVAFSNFNFRNGVYKFLSYRDPNLLGTLDAYDQAASFLTNLDIDAESLDRAVVGTLGDVDKYHLPDKKGATALARYLLQDSDEERQERREQIASTNPQNFKEFGEALATLVSQSTVAVAASAESIDEAKRKRPELQLQSVDVMKNSPE